MASESAPEWLNKGDNSWQLAAATLVGLQSVPGLVILYGSIVKKKWAVNSAFMALYAFAVTFVCWSLWAFRMSFGDRLLPFLGRPDLAALDQRFLLAQGFAGLYPSATLVYFQFVFAAITLILIAGALLGRMNFKAWMLFVPLWLTFSYTVGAFSVWSPNGFLFKAGVMDFAGGYVIHLSSGVAGLTAAYWVGPRMAKDRERFPPNNILLTLTGAGLLWMGWTGFNGGAPYAANIDASMAILNTHLCTATSLLVWLCLDMFVFGKPSVIGAVQGMITGLVCITPAAGLVQGWAAIIMGVLSGSTPWFTMMVLHKRIRFLKRVDDTLAVFHTHAVAGSLGGILTGIFAEPRLNRLFFGDDPKYVGLAYALKMGRAAAGFRQIGMQLAGIVFIISVNVTVTTLVCLLVRLAVPLRLSDDELQIGDDAIHGEDAYAVWGDGETYERSIHGVQNFALPTTLAEAA
ncbi:putative ammonium transporter 4 member 1 [Ananas comosus]|uniref:Ammonium transporter n=2 Tax=Ananas comosus TaxID=4615 RepID=A0A6P5FFB2_ANACO|nr:putative ammonium transporter 4 member 1 [Ananas comosus]XP_020094644.1 putative ammonium transporter 4 member 1 [Ananas comosus]